MKGAPGRIGASWGVKDTPLWSWGISEKEGCPAVGLASLGARDILLWGWGISGEMGHPGMALEYLEGQGTSSCRCG